MPFFTIVADESSAESMTETRVLRYGVPATTPLVQDFSGVAGLTNGTPEGAGHTDGEAKPGSNANALLSFDRSPVYVSVLESPSNPGNASSLVSFNGALVPRLAEWEEAADLATYKAAKGIA